MLSTSKTGCKRSFSVPNVSGIGLSTLLFVCKAVLETYRCLYRKVCLRSEGYESILVRMGQYLKSLSAERVLEARENQSRDDGVAAGLYDENRKNRLKLVERLFHGPACTETCS